MTLPVIFSQFDDRWAKKLLGFNLDPNFNFYNYACLICTLANIARYYGFDETPLTINDKLKALGPGNGFQQGSANYVWDSFTKLFPKIKEKKTETPSKLTDAHMAEIKDALDKGFLVVVQIDVNPSTVKNDTHYSSLVGYNPQDENDFTLADTLGGQSVSLKKYLKFLRPSARDSIFKYIIYEGKTPTNTVGVPVDIYPQIIHGSTEWDKTVQEYLPGNDPKATQFEDVRSVVGGYKSRATTLENERNEAQRALAVSEQEVLNQKDKVANVIRECQTQVYSKNSEISTLSDSIEAMDAQIQSLTTQVDDLGGQLRVAQKTIGLRDLAITGLSTDLEVCKNKPNNGNQPVDSLTAPELLAKLLEKILTKK
jgi:chaperonin cofactor prefoldin